MKFDLRTTSVLRIGYSYYVSLPMQWVRNNEMGKGSKLQASIDEKKRLILEPAKETETAEVHND